ncbi:hypothetical protein DFQ28_008553 [Apophysomyces sp. BC1034]|nr:hypothetical protein DFQ30_008264 [Apophysomyces sp. BC1015]KAG0174957.1 hypothetical protein DFQ29_007313 [Apophysomyces sp. BC1021]KAG0185932.1 hypothetical protein DFQ28_008553 [Apophysomyces sp. BC1034]
MTLKMNFLGYKKEVIRPLNDARAIESGANFMSESFVFGVAASIIVAESWRSHSSEKHRRNRVDDSLEDLESQVAQLTTKMEEMQKTHKATEGRLQEMDEVNEQLRKLLHEILSVSMGLKRHAEYEQQPTIVTLPGFGDSN